MIDPAEIQAFDDRAGFELVSYREVALPIYLLTLDVLVLEERPLPPLQEFVLRSIDAGLSTVAEISGLLGIEERVVVRSASALQLSDDVVLSGGTSNRHRLDLTLKGHETLEILQSVRKVETTAPVMVDGLTRRILGAFPRKVGAFPASEIGGRDLVEIPPHPQRKPRLVEVPQEEAMSVLNDEGRQRGSGQEVIGVFGIGRNRNFAREAVALAYRSTSGHETQVAFLIDGILSDEHAAAFATAQRRAQRKVIPAEWKSAEELFAEHLEVETLNATADPERTRPLARERAEAELARDAILQDARLGGDESTNESVALDEANARIASLEAKLAEYSVRHVSVWEHREYLSRAFREAKARILIVSPWIRAGVVNNQLLGSFGVCLSEE